MHLKSDGIKSDGDQMNDKMIWIAYAGQIIKSNQE
jgi:hypothetical protein